MNKKQYYNSFIIVIIFVILIDLVSAKGDSHGSHGDGESHESGGSDGSHFNPGINEGNVKNECTQIKNHIYTYLILFVSFKFYINFLNYSI
jgi:hypothetical protein